MLHSSVRVWKCLYASTELAMVLKKYPRFCWTFPDERNERANLIRSLHIASKNIKVAVEGADILPGILAVLCIRLRL